MLIFVFYLLLFLMRKYILYIYVFSFFFIIYRREYVYNCLILDIVWELEFWEYLKFGFFISIFI